jgi:hypothetical protein
VLIGAILVRCLPNRIEQEGGQIRLVAAAVSEDCPLPEEVPPGAAIVEGAIRTVQVNAYERDPIARRRCIEDHGTNCSVCKFNFGAVYGPVAEGYIHVHHLRPLSEIGKEHLVDPVADLRPVCPNCHAVLHQRNPVFSIKELKELMRQQKQGGSHAATNQSRKKNNGRVPRPRRN